MIEVQMNTGVMAFGMSITDGQQAANAANYWVNRFSQFIGGSVTNLAVGGSGLQSMVQQAYANVPYGTSRSQNGLIDGPLNDVRQAGAACLPSVKPAYDALIATLFSAGGYFRGAAWPSPSVVRSGVWSSLPASYGGRSNKFPPNTPMQTFDPLASITFLFDGPVVALHGFASETDDWLDMEIEIDGSPWGITRWANSARPGTGKQAVATVIDGLGAGSHTVKVKAPAAGIPVGHRCVVDGIQCPTMAAPVILGTVPNIPNWAYSGAIGTWADAQACNAIINQVAAQWTARGYPVGVAVVGGQPYDYAADGVHRTDRGHLNWALDYLSSVRIKP